MDGVQSFRCECAKGFQGRHCEQTVNIHLFNATDASEWALCRQNNCPAKADDGRCDPECNYFACSFDGGDCSAGLQPFAACEAASYCAHVYADGKCDPVCDEEACLFDGFDCANVADGRKDCNPLIRAFCDAHFADGSCDERCNNMRCGWDGGDCDGAEEVLGGDVVLVILDDPDTFIATKTHFLSEISKVQPPFLPLPLLLLLTAPLSSAGTRDCPYQATAHG